MATTSINSAYGKPLEKNPGLVPTGSSVVVKPADGKKREEPPRKGFDQNTPRTGD